MVEFIKRLNQEAMLISDLKDGMAYTLFLNGLWNRWLKFLLAQQKRTTLIEALNKVRDFIRTTEICTKIGNGKVKGRIEERNQTQAERT